MDWIDIASIMFVCVTMNHLGLIKAIEEETDRELPILNCPKCSTMWSTLLYCVLTSKQIIIPLAVSFLSSYVAIWFELFEGYIDTLFMKLYDKIYSASDNEASSDSDGGNSASTLSKL